MLTYKNSYTKIHIAISCIPYLELPERVPRRDVETASDTAPTVALGSQEGPELARACSILNLAVRDVFTTANALSLGFCAAGLPHTQERKVRPCLIQPAPHDSF
jgi:hypothetical protein